MARPRKVIRTKRLYKKHNVNTKAIKTIFFILLLLALVFLGFIVSEELAKRFGNKKDAVSSLPVESQEPPQNDSSVSEEASSDDKQDEVSTSTTEKDVDKQINALFVSATELITGGYIERALSDGYNAICVELKTEDGIIYYNSSLEEAKKYNAISETAIDINALSESIKQKGLIPMAKISSLKDATAPHVENENSYAYSSYLETNWLDDSVARGGKPWLNPYMPKARKYIVDIAKEITDAGFEIIVLDNVMFPDKYTEQLNLINETKPYNEILRQLIDEVSAVSKNVYVEYGNEAFIKTVDNPYYVSAKEIGYENVILSVDKFKHEEGVADQASADIAKVGELLSVATSQFENIIYTDIESSDVVRAKVVGHMLDEEKVKGIIK